MSQFIGINNLQDETFKIVHPDNAGAISINSNDIAVTANLGLRNILINGDFRINQRGATTKTTTSGAYNFDRWFFDGTYLIQKVEEGNYRYNTVYTLSGTNVTTIQMTSPASGHWTITVPATADMVQLEEGSVATPFELRPIGLELSLCQRYYETISATPVTAGNR